ncbi:hypothetical protein [Halocatena pleomorpha]|uniref:Uncharacterized protein n=1 Tax=Halocatena pleomorpha TaxID=1785090 RepID=A0A3P3RAU6_9EURY|nr:hypothetical protein [Halocatena pleomorpha]RRJ30524.1 hypothetical protein EIK79_09565 [Halocatena pleomorpha]
MGATTDSNATGTRSHGGSKLSGFVFDQPFRTVVATAVVLASGTGIIAFAYITALTWLKIAPRTDALLTMGVLGVLLLTSVNFLGHLRQSEAIHRGIESVREQRTRGSEELANLHEQTEKLHQAMGLLTEQQATHRALYSPALEVDWLRSTSRDESADGAQFTVTNLSFGAALDVTVRSEIELINPPEDYSVNGSHAICPATRTDSPHQSVRIPPYAEGQDIGMIVLVDVSENIPEQARKHTVTCRFTDAMRVFYEDGVEAIDLSFEITYEDVFGEEYTERIQLPRADLTEEMTLDDVLSSTPRTNGRPDDTEV